MRFAPAGSALAILVLLLVSVVSGLPGAAAAGPSYTSHLNVVYCTMTFGSTTYSLPMNIYTPTSGSNHPVVLWIPGGGWNTTGVPTVSPGTLFAGLVANLTVRGIAVASIGYQGYPNAVWPAQIEEAKCAVRFLKSSAATYGLNQFQVGAYGRSTGAHLVELMGLTGTSAGWDVQQYLTFSSSIKAAIDVSGPSNLTQDASLSPGVAGKIDQVFGSAFSNELAGSAIDYMTSPTPRYLLLYGINDTLIGYPQATGLQTYLNSNGVSSTLVLVDNAAHGLAAIPGSNESPSLSQTDLASVNFFVAAFKSTIATPTVSVSASPSSIGIGASAGASVTLSGGSTPTGFVTFTAYSSCTGRSLVFTSTVAVSGAGVYASPSFTPTTTGTFYWTAAYSGDANNSPVGTVCGAAGSTVTVSSSGPFLSVTSAPSSIVFDTSAAASATLSGETSPTGTMTFHLYNATGCASSALVFTTWATVSGNAVYTSKSYSPTTTGTFYWTASYSGDANNSPISTTCGSPGSALTVQKWQPSMAVTVSPSSVTTGQQATASVLMTGATLGAQGTITFSVYTSLSCTPSSLVWTSSPDTVNSDGTYLSGPFTPSAPGSYYWQATYSGDSFNNPATNPCSSPNSILKVSLSSPTLTVSASPSAASFGQPVSSSANLSSGASPTGTITFTAYSASTCTTSSQVFTSSATVTGTGVYSSGSFAPSAAGTYYWTAAYSGDSNNGPASTTCGVAGSSVSVSSIPLVSSFSYTDTPTGNDPTLGTGTVVYTFTITNDGTETFTLGGSLSVTSTASVTCTGGNSLTLSGSVAAGASATFSLTCTYSGSTGQTVTATLAATYTDPSGLQGTVSGSPATQSLTIDQ